MRKEAKIKIQDLIRKYETVKESDKIGRYTEEETKKDFILPLSEALGWDVYNSKEVSAEEQISGDRVDYGFYLNGQPKFYLETKKLSVDLHREEFAKQAIRYSWNKGVTWAVLTNFECLIIFNALSPEKSLAGKKYLAFTYQEYLTRFDELWRLSREAFGEDVLDKEAEKVGKKLQKISVTETLAKDLNECRDLLTNSFREWNEKEDPYLIDEGVQKVLNRLIFIRSAEDRKIEPPTLRPLINEWVAGGREGSPYQAMVKKFREFDEIYDSNLFDHHPFEGWEEHSEATEKVIEILEGKKNYFEYDFSIIPADVLGNVYESYLGHQLKKSKKQKEVNGKNLKKRKEQGIYYTPKFIVDYIVQNALGPVLDRCKSINDLQKVKILDPACGSGSFLVAAMNFILKKYEDFSVKKIDGYLKIQVLQNNIYGVDLDQQAVELARLNLLLNTFDSKIKLPGLENNIKNGNSLISGTDEELKKYFGKNYRDKKPFNWQEEFSDVFKQGGFDCVIGNPPYISAIQDSKGDLAIREFYRHKYSLRGAFDVYVAFLINGIQIGNKDSSYGWIIPNKLMVADYAKDAMKFLRENGLYAIVDVSNLKVFGNVGVYPIIILGDKTRGDFQEYEVKSVAGLQTGKIKVFPHFSRYKNFKDLGIKIASGATGFQARLLVDYLGENQDEGAIPFVVSGSIDPYSVSLENIRYMGTSYKYAYIKKGDGIAESKWFFWSKGKIVISGMTKRIEAYYSTEPLALGVGVYAIYDYAGLSPYFLLAVLNSSFLTNYFREEFKHKHLAGGYLAINKSTLEELPIVEPNAQTEKLLAGLAKSRILLTNEFNKSSENSDQWHKIKDEIAKTDRKIDEEVYKLYGLTEEEIKIVEEK